MSYEKLGLETLNYDPCRYPGAKLLFRGPRRSLEGDYIAFLGGTDTYGKFIAQPFAGLIERDTGLRCVNFGWPNAGADVYLKEPGVLQHASNAQLTVLQLPCAQNMSNRFYRVHPRRNDRFVRASKKLRKLYPEVDFTEFHFVRHMLRHLQALSSERFEDVIEELSEAWPPRLRLLLSQIDAPVLLLWFSLRRPEEDETSLRITHDPGFVSRDMIEDLRSEVADLIEFQPSETARKAGQAGMVFSQIEAPAAAELMGPTAHVEVAQLLAPAIVDLIK
ncbi:hypothetical protein ROA7450_02649 [Roseovarius albus]|uniref:DUF6473 domain-containing protein n=1 Tax=Roseovarius albus TaxID=1247867 RepID=A0A1X6ZIC7_9RHOB|nr:DUF6473 family protein [Roseovarius albus]SLN52598.1 hypothetical protein ROA7450_02649 [Roseovarius albus]